MIASLAGGVVSLAAAAALSYALLAAWVPRMVSYAVGAMLGAAFLDLLPEAFRQANSIEALFAVTLGGLLVFFMLEKAALWRHRHAGEDGAHAGRERHGKSGMGLLIVVGDGFHNFVDGVLIAAAFITDARLGVTTTLAIAAHEIPQEIGDFMVLLHAGYTRRRALALNFASGLAAVAGGIVGYFALDYARNATPHVLALAAASFIYIAVADLIPDLHRARDTRATLWQVMLIAAGVATMAGAQAVLRPG
ncbi:MAG: ZIP family metal transporter [Burkholderiales bacterium]|nr:ZIP family metal transporter [Burkholderiales bacterium]